MIYLVCQEWSNTKDNHAGMKYLCEEMERRYPDCYKSISVDDVYSDCGNSSSRIIRRYRFFKAEQKIKSYIKVLASDLTNKVKEGEDSVVLMEYLLPGVPQYLIAKRLKKYKPNVSIYALCHLVPSKIDKAFSSSNLKKWADTVDCLFTLGDSLSQYLQNRGVSSSKIKTLFHYVDEYYFHRTAVVRDGKLRVIAMGNQMRNVELLKQVVRNNPQVNFIVCQGTENMQSDFDGCSNVTLIPFVSEPELRDYMEQSNVSLNVMEDTIGSNVIVTSMAMGLAMIVSDVGSIRNYCDESNAIFCENTVQSFSEAIGRMVDNLDDVYTMQEESIRIARNLTIDKFHEDLQSIVLSK